MYDVTSYGGAMKLAADAFKYLNGKVNYIIPAHCLLFGNSTMTSFGDTTLDIVEINIPCILNDINATQPNRISGLILYTIVHELLHIDQYMAIYYNITNRNLVQSEKLVELSAHAMTSKVLDILTESNFLKDLDLDEVALPPCEMFMELESYDTESLLVYENSFYRVPSPEENAFFYLERFIDIDFKDLFQQTNPLSIVLELRINNKQIGRDYIYYLHHWLRPQIYNIIRPLAILRKASRTKNIRILLDNCYVESNEENNANVVYLTIGYQTTAPLEIVYNS